MTNRCAGRCCENRPGWEWVEDPVTHAREKRRQKPLPGQHGTEGHECVPNMAADGSRLCLGCERALAECIGEMPTYATDLSRAITHSGERQRTVRGDEAPDFALPRRRVEALNQLAHDVTWWVRLVSSERGLASPELAESMPVLSVWRGARWLRGHAGWLAARDDDPHPLVSWRAMRSDAAHAMDLPRDRARFDVGPCPEDCEGIVRAFIGTESSDSAMGCDTNTEHQWTPSQFYRAGRRIKLKAEGGA